MKTEAPALEMIILDRIIPSPLNPRKNFDQQAMAELAESIRTKGVLQPVLLRPAPNFRLVTGKNGKRQGWFWENLKDQILFGFSTDQKKAEANPPLELVAGERRFRAAKLAGLKAIPAVVRELSDKDALEAMVIENEQRADVSPMEKADGYHALIAKHGVGLEILAARVGKAPSTIRGLLKLRALPLRAREALDAGEISSSVAQLIGRVPSEALREQLTLHVLAGEEHWHGGLDDRDVAVNRNLGIEPLSYRQVKELVARSLMVELKGAPFSRKALDLVPGAGSCDECPYRVGNLQQADPEGYEGCRADVCTSPDCYQRKVAAHREKLLAKARKQGVEVVGEVGAAGMFSTDGALLGSSWTDLEASFPNGKTPPVTYRELIGRQVEPHTMAAVDPRGKLRYLVPTKQAEKALIAGGLLPDLKFNGNGKSILVSKSGGPTPEDLEPSNEPANDTPAAELAPEPEAEPERKRNPPNVDIKERMAAIAGEVLYEMGANNPDGLEGLQEQGESYTCAAWEAMKLLCLCALEDELENEVLYDEDTAGNLLADKLPNAPPDPGALGAWQGWIDSAEPAQLIGLLLKANMQRVLRYNPGSGERSRDALLEWAEIDFEQLQDQARREAKGEPAAVVAEVASDGPFTAPGDVIRTSYGTGPYVVVSIQESGHRNKRPVYSMTLNDQHNPKPRKNRQSYLNNYQQQSDGRITAVNGDELIVLPAGTDGGPTYWDWLKAAGVEDDQSERQDLQRRWMRGDPARESANDDLAAKVQPPPGSAVTVPVGSIDQPPRTLTPEPIAGLGVDPAQLDAAYVTADLVGSGKRDKPIVAKAFTFEPGGRRWVTLDSSHGDGGSRTWRIRPLCSRERWNNDYPGQPVKLMPGDDSDPCGCQVKVGRHLLIIAGECEERLLVLEAPKESARERIQRRQMLLSEITRETSILDLFTDGIESDDYAALEKWAGKDKDGMTLGRLLLRIGPPPKGGSMVSRVYTYLRNIPGLSVPAAECIGDALVEADLVPRDKLEGAMA